MKVKLDDPVMLLKAIEVISELITEVRIKINDFGMSITAIDPANVAMVSFKLPKSAFSQFEAGDETIGINLDNLKRILKRCDAGSSLVLERRENNLDILIQGKIRRDFSLSLLELEGEEKEMPNLEYTAKVEIPSADLGDSIDDCLVVADACSFIIKEGKFIIESKGLNSARSEFSSDDALITAEECKSRYSLEYLQKFMKGAKLSEKAHLSFATDHPLRLDFKADHLELGFILAPRVETED